MAKKMRQSLLSDFDAIRLRNLASEAKVAFDNWSNTNKELDALLDRLSLLESAEEAPHIGVKKVDPILDRAIADLRVTRERFAQDERSALLEIERELLRLVPTDVLSDYDEPASNLSSISLTTRALVGLNCGKENIDNVLKETIAMVEEVGGTKRATDLLTMQVMIVDDLRGNSGKEGNDDD